MSVLVQIVSSAAVAGRSRVLAPFAIGMAALVLAGCAQQPQQRVSYQRGKEYFPEGKYGRASPRVVAEGDAVPKGGGRYLVGRPYTIAGRTYVPSEKSASYSVTGMASWYGSAFHGRRTANGEIYDMRSVTAAHPTMPLPSYARVTNLGNGKSIIVRVNDRGPYHGGRVMDLSQRVADLLEFRGAGTARVKVDYVGKASTGGSDDARLLASLRTGAPAQLDGYSTPGETMIAEAPPTPRQTPAPTPARAPEPATPPAAATTIAVRQTVVEPPAPAGVASLTMPENPPMPPARPFDLGAPAPTASAPAGSRAPVAATPAAPAPPRRAQVSAIYFAPDASLATRFERAGPFAGLRGQGFASPRR